MEKFTAEMIAGFLGGEVVGDPAAAVSTLAKIEEGKPGALSFLSNPKYEPYIYDTESSIVIVNRSFEPAAPVKATMVRVDDAYACFAKLLELYAASKPQKTGQSSLASVSKTATVGANCYIGEFAVIGDNASVGDNVKIYPHVYVGDNVKIGDNTTLFPSVTIYEECVIGSNVTIDSGSVIGADGFGWAPSENGEYSKIPQLGNVVIEDNVSIGANTCVDRATMGSTMIHRGVKLDNLVQIGHNASVGENTVAASGLGLAGSSKIGKNVLIAGQVGIAGHINIGNNVTLGSKSGVSNSIKDGETYMGYPAVPGMTFHRSSAIYKKLPELDRKIFQLEKQVARLTALLEEKE